MSKPISCVYALMDPADGRTYYVGQTTHSSRRMQGHFSQGPVRDWLRGLIQGQQRPRVVVLERGRRGSLGLAERRWIHYYHTRHEALLNAKSPGPPQQFEFKWDPFAGITMTCVSCRWTWETYRRASCTTKLLICWDCDQPLHMELKAASGNRVVSPRRRRKLEGGRA